MPIIIWFFFLTGDIVSLEVGDRVPADVRLARVNELSVDESSFTGEPVQKLKQVATVTGHGQEKLHISDMSNVAFQGTLVTSKQLITYYLLLFLLLYTIFDLKDFSFLKNFSWNQILPFFQVGMALGLLYLLENGRNLANFFAWCEKKKRQELRCKKAWTLWENNFQYIP